MSNLHPAVRLVISIAVFVIAWNVIDWLAVNYVFHDVYEFGVGKHIVAPIVAAAVFWGIEFKRDKDKIGK